MFFPEPNSPVTSEMLRTKPEWNQQMILSDGRALSFADYGDPAGEPFLYCHGFPGSRYEGALIHNNAKRMKIRVIATDRPGIGRSTYKENRTLLDYPADIAELAENLRIDDFSIIGVSGGAPYALSCAYAIPEKLRNVMIICGLGPYSFRRAMKKMSWIARGAFGTANKFPDIASAVLPSIGNFLIGRHTDKALKFMAMQLSPPDKKVFSQKEVYDIFRTSFNEAFRNGGKGPAADIRIYSKSWNFDVRKIRKQVYFWHGLQDKVVPPEFTKIMSGLIPNAKTFYLPNEGHFSLPVNFQNRIIRQALSEE